MSTWDGLNNHMRQTGIDNSGKGQPSKMLMSEVGTFGALDLDQFEAFLGP